MLDFLRNLTRRISVRRGFTTVRAHTSDHSKIKFKTRNALEYDKILENDGEQKFLDKFLDILQSDDVLFDIGANIGLFSMYAATVVKDQNIYSFEPVKVYYDILLENMDLNDKTDINTFNFGLGEKDESLPFVYKNKIGSGMGSGSENYRQVYKMEAKEQLCEIKKGDTLISNASLPIPKVLKIDVEGMELEVLKGLRKTLQHDACKYVFCEIHTKLKPELYVEVCRMLQNLSFKTENIYAKTEGIGVVGFKYPEA